MSKDRDIFRVMVWPYQVCVNKNNVHSFNSGQEKTDLSDILMLHFNGGENISITVSGKYIRQEELKGDSICYWH